MTPALSAFGERQGAIALLSARDRAGALLLVGLIHVGLAALLMLLQTNAAAIKDLREKLTVVDVRPPPPPPPSPPPPKPRPTEAVRPAPSAPAPLRLPDIAAPAPLLPPIVFPPTVQTPPGQASSGSGSTSSADGVAGAGSTGSGGKGGAGGGAVSPDDVVIVTGQWARVPTADDFRPAPNTLPGAPRTGWGEIVCRTARNNRLTDCVVHDEFPKGSGFAEAMRVTASRFRYRATDSHGNPAIGWRVRVHLNFLEPKRR